jgi:hypothetical protein
MGKGEVAGAVTLPRYLFAIESVLPTPEIGSLTSVDGRCTPRVAAAKDWDVAPIIRSFIVLAVGCPASSPSRLRRSLREA